ncbi:reverse transcriptase domain-containing protein, partial [Tanacetum coccineum]
NCPATHGNVYRDNISEYVSQAAAANYNQVSSNFRPQMVANHIRPPGFPPVQNSQANNANNFNRGNNFNQNRESNFNQNRGGNFNQSNFSQNQLHRPQVNQSPAYQAPVPQTHSVEQQKDKVAENVRNKRKWEGDHGGSSSQQQKKEHKVIRAHTVRPSNKKGYTGNLPLCNKCKFHHTGPCAVKCGNFKRVGHQTIDCRTLVSRVKQRPSVEKHKAEVTCYECGRLEHYKSDCPIRKNQNQVNK